MVLSSWSTPSSEFFVGGFVAAFALVARDRVVKHFQSLLTSLALRGDAGFDIRDDPRVSLAPHRISSSWGAPWSVERYALTILGRRIYDWAAQTEFERKVRELRRVQHERETAFESWLGRRVDARPARASAGALGRPASVPGVPGGTPSVSAARRRETAGTESNTCSDQVCRRVS